MNLNSLTRHKSIGSMKIFLSTQKTFKFSGIFRPQAFEKFSINIRNVMILCSHSLSFILPLIYILGYAQHFRETSDGFYCSACGLINFGNLIVFILNATKIFQLIDDFEEAIAESMFVFRYKRVQIK